MSKLKYAIEKNWFVNHQQILEPSLMSSFVREVN